MDTATQQFVRHTLATRGGYAPASISSASSAPATNALNRALHHSMDTGFINRIIEDRERNGYNGEEPEGDTEGQQIVEDLDHALLEEFKNQVRTWWELDTAIKRLQAALKDRRAMQNTLGARILDFMRKHNIEDLNTKEGILRYKASFVKAPLSQKVVKTKLMEYFQQDQRAVDFLKKMFDERERVEKVSLRRLH